MTAIIDNVQNVATNWIERPGEPSWLTDLRKVNLERFAKKGFPTRRDEDWRWTNLSGLTNQDLRRVSEIGSIDASLIRPFLLEGVNGDVLVFIDGVFSADLSRLSDPGEGVVVRNLAAAVGNGSTSIQGKIGSIASHEDRPFIALNSAFIADGAFIEVADGKTIHDPVQLVYVTTKHDAGVATHPRNLFSVGANASCTIVESYVSLGEATDLTNPVTEVVCGEKSNVRHYRMQRENHAVYHMATTALRQETGSRYHGTFVNLGGAVSRHEALAMLDGEHIECILDALSIGTGSQLHDNHTRMEHAKPNCHSHQIFKGIYDGQSRGIFDGKIHVWRDAQKTDAVQTSRGLLLSDDAVSNNKPQLEIYADDVKCTHGATTGQLDEQQVFYLRSRGLDEDASRSLLTYAFACEVTERIDLEPFEKAVQHELLTRLPMGGLIQGAI